MRTLGIDLGTVRVGVAVSDELGVMASPLAPIARTADEEDFLGALRRLVEEYDVTRIVIGLPMRLDGTEAEEARKARDLSSRLGETLKIEVTLWDERMSTRQAERVMIDAGVRRKKRKQRIDSVAAAIVLQSFLDARPP